MTAETKAITLVLLAVGVTFMVGFCLESADPLSRRFRWKAFVALSAIIWGLFAYLGYLAICGMTP